jgi:biopolymer transport protein TolR
MADINVTPMVDVMLVLLIIFMVTAPLMLAGVPVNLPDSRAQALGDQDKPIEISIGSDGQLYLGEEPVTDAMLPERLAAIAASNANDQPQILLRADRVLDFGRVMHVMGEISRAGLTRVALVTLEGDGQDN